MNEKDRLIIERNKILDSPLKIFLPLKYFLFFYRKKLSEIDAKIDKLDLQTKDDFEESDLNKTIEIFQARLKKHSKYLHFK
jgi:hypothetical protein